MSEIVVRRVHNLGLPRSRRMARIWSSTAMEKLGMTCINIQGDICDRIEFSRPGVSGVMHVMPEYLEVRVTLGLLFKSFSGQVEAEVKRRLEESVVNELKRPEPWQAPEEA